MRCCVIHNNCIAFRKWKFSKYIIQIKLLITKNPNTIFGIGNWSSAEGKEIIKGHIPDLIRNLK
jgi:hypothetical protein